MKRASRRRPAQIFCIALVQAGVPPFVFWVRKPNAGGDLPPACRPTIPYVEGRVRHREVGAEVRVLVVDEGIGWFLAEIEADAADSHISYRQPPSGGIAFLPEDHDVAEDGQRRSRAFCRVRVGRLGGTHLAGGELTTRTRIGCWGRTNPGRENPFPAIEIASAEGGDESRAVQECAELAPANGRGRLAAGGDINSAGERRSLLSREQAPGRFGWSKLQHSGAPQSRNEPLSPKAFRFSSLTTASAS
jgi:hypothetical protein